MTAALEIRTVTWICGSAGCDSVQQIRCADCGWAAPYVPPVEGELPFDNPEHSELDCARYRREHPAPRPLGGGARRGPVRADRAWARIHERHAPARLVRRPPGVLTCPTCGYQP